VPREYVEPHASSPQPPAPTSFPVEVSHSPQYFSKPRATANIDTQKETTPPPPGLLHVRRKYSAQLFRGPNLFHAEDTPELHGSGPVSTRLPHHGYTTHTTSRWKF
jgi:hypothetical protein